MCHADRPSPRYSARVGPFARKMTQSVHHDCFRSDGRRQTVFADDDESRGIPFVAPALMTAALITECYLTRPSDSCWIVRGQPRKEVKRHRTLYKQIWRQGYWRA